MNIALSNIAWDHAEDAAVALVMRRFQVHAVEIAPTKLWVKPEQATEEEMSETKLWWANQNIEIVSAQSLLYGHPELEIFSSRTVRQATLEYLKKIIQVCGKLGAKRLVFGSPKNRLVRNLTHSQALNIAIPFFQELGQVAQAAHTCLCIEPNPAQYGCDFVRTAEEGIELVKAVQQPGFRLHLDGAALTLNGEDYQEVLEKSFEYLAHVHASDPNLGLVGGGLTRHAELAQILRSLGYTGYVSIEMKSGLGTSNVASVEAALQFVTSTYS